MSTVHKPLGFIYLAKAEPGLQEEIQVEVKDVEMINAEEHPGVVKQIEELVGSYDMASRILEIASLKLQDENYFLLESSTNMPCLFLTPVFPTHLLEAIQLLDEASNDLTIDKIHDLHTLLIFRKSKIPGIVTENDIHLEIVKDVVKALRGQNLINLIFCVFTGSSFAIQRWNVDKMHGICHN